MITLLKEHDQLLIWICEGRFDPAAKQRVDELLSGGAIEPMAFLQAAIHHRVAGTVFRNLADWDWMWRIYGIANRSLHQLAIGTRVINRLMREEASLICGSLVEAGVPCAIIKGPAIEELAYNGVEERHYGDIDLLVARDSLDSVKAVLNARGFVQGEYRGRGEILPAPKRELVRSVLHTHETIPFVRHLDGNVSQMALDVNFMFSWRGHPKQPIGLKIDPRELLPHAQTSPSPRPDIPILPPEISLLGLCSHIMSEACLFMFANPKWAIAKQDHLLSRNTDIYYLLKSSAIDWGIVDNLAASPGAREALLYGLQATAQVYESLVAPREWLEGRSSMLDKFVLPSGDLAAWETDYAQRLMRPNERVKEAFRRLRGDASLLKQWGLAADTEKVGVTDD